jgi:16S rRNA (guanine966-N2)-methyltransferase
MIGRIRIIGGRWRGRKLSVPDSPGLRPTGDRARETLFNWLGPRVVGAHCVDLFAGSGALGFEAASRGAASVALVEKDPALARSLATAIEGWPGSEVVSVHQADAMDWLTQPRGAFDIAFIDPPFGLGLQDRVLDRLTGSASVRSGSLVYVEQPRSEQSSELPALELIRHKSQGRVTLSLLAVRPEPHESL